jgi:hypothetical protein
MDAPYKVPVVVREDYRIYFQPLSGANFIHCDVFNWNKTVRKDLLETFDQLKKLYGQPIFAIHQEYQDNTHIKFLKMFGFKKIDEAEDLAGNPVDFYITNEDK